MCLFLGLAWGGGNAVAHRVADAIMGPRVVKVETVAAPAPVAAAQAASSMAATPNACVGQYKAFEEVSSLFSYELMCIKLQLFL